MDETQEAPSVESRIAEKMMRASEPEVKKEPEAEDSSPEAQPETAEAEEAQPSEVEADAKDGGSDEEPFTVSSLAELMEHAGADVDSMYDLTFPVTINGKKENVPLSQIKDSYRATQDATRFQEEAKAAREEAKRYAEQTNTTIKTQLAQAHALAQGLDQMYLAPFQQVDWNALRADDPAEYSARRQEYMDAQQAVQAKKQSVLQEIQAFQEKAKAEQAESVQQQLARERDALYEKWPEMGDEKKGDAARASVIDFLKKDGFTDDEIGSVSDHRVLLMARDAMRFREQAKQADVAKKKVVKIGSKVLTPGAAQSKAEGRRAAVDPLRQKLRKSGKVEDFAALLSEKIRR